jgi:hypothetical protein
VSNECEQRKKKSHSPQLDVKRVATKRIGKNCGEKLTRYIKINNRRVKHLTLSCMI